MKKIRQAAEIDKIINVSNKDFLEKERHILLELGKDITKIRDKNDLIILFSKRIREWYDFTHAVVTLIDHKNQTYKPFLLDSRFSLESYQPIRNKLSNILFNLDEPLIQSVLVSESPMSFVVENEMDKSQSPIFLRANYEIGVRQILITTLWNNDKPLGFINLYTDKEEGFSSELLSIIHGIAPQISNAVSNILNNEEIQKKEQEKSFLLDLGYDIAAVRTKQDLSLAIQTALSKLNSLQGFVIRKVNEDGQTMTTYISDERLHEVNKAVLSKISITKFPINDGLQNRVLDSYIPLLFNVNIEINRGITSEYLFFWKDLGFKEMVGIALRNAELNLGILWMAIDEVNISLLQGICAQISTGMANVMANEALENKNSEQSVLLQFSNEIACVRTKDDLQLAIIKVLRELLDTKLAMIHIFDEDGFGLTPYMSDTSLFKDAMPNHDERIANKLTIQEPYTEKVIKSSEPVIFNVDEELKATNSLYAQLWKKVGFKNTYGALLRVGNTNIGTLWLLADQLDSTIVKGICSQISMAIANILANEKLILYKQQLEHENVYLKEQIKSIYNFAEIIGSGKQMQKVYNLMSLVAESNSTVLILGETGTGKELIARAIHNASPRKEKLMIKVNCAAMPANLIESELFGHEKGSFTGATERRIGKFELANNSTLFLDEIGEMPLEAQVKLLRVIQERELERVGGKDTVKVNVRIIAATNRDLEEEVKAGRFRSDLFYRLNVFPITLPPLRDRMEDIEALSNFFVSKYNKNNGKNIVRISGKVIQKLYSYSWPGNIRELEHLLERSVLLTQGSVLQEVFIPEKTNSTENNEENHSGKTLEEMERSFIINALKRCQGKISGAGGAAELLNIPGNTLHSKMKKLLITKADYYN